VAIRATGMSGSGSGASLGLTLPFDKHAVSSRVVLEPLLLLGGGRALLLQVGHPLVAAGVDQHSDYTTDPFARLARTLDVMMKMAFASPEISARQGVILAKRHARVHGVSDDGVEYSAMDPGLLLWVWATLIDTSVLVYERLYSPLSTPDRARLYEEQKLIAQACGVPLEACPPTLLDFTNYFDGVVTNELRVTEPARRVARTVMRAQLRGPLGTLTDTPNQLMTAGLLPPRVRDDYGFAWDERKEQQLNRLFWAFGRGSRLVPAPLRQLPMRLMVNSKRPLKVPALLQART
jgi:uncharacterized protein (DUF2236 family)